MEEFLLESESGKVSCALEEVENSKSIAILTHGYLSNKFSRTNKELMGRLKRSGITTLLFDIYGHGKSEGSVEDLTVSKALNNTDAVYYFAETRGYTKVGLMGSSFSGQSCLLSAAKHHYDAIVLKCPVYDYKKLLDLQIGEAGLAVWKEKGHITPFGRRWGYGVYEDSSRYDMRSAVSKVRAPTLVIHGDKDNIVPISQSEELVSGLGSNGRLLVVPGADHLFNEPAHFEKMVQASHDWFYKHLVA